MDFDKAESIIFKATDSALIEILAGGLCGSMPPRALWVEGVESWRPSSLDDFKVDSNETFALALVWDKTILWRGFAELKELSPRTLLRTKCNDIYGAYVWALAFERAGLGTVHVLNEDGVELTGE